jgi:hypothetical protein
MKKLAPEDTAEIEKNFAGHGIRGTMPIVHQPKWVPDPEEPEPERPPEEKIGRRMSALEQGVAMEQHGLSLAEPPPELANEIVPARRLQWILEKVIQAERKKISVLDATRISGICEHTARLALTARYIRDHHEKLSIDQYTKLMDAKGKAVTQREQLMGKLFEGIDLNESQGDQLSAAMKTVDEGAKTPEASWDDLEEGGDAS